MLYRRQLGYQSIKKLHKSSCTEAGLPPFLESTPGGVDKEASECVHFGKLYMTDTIDLAISLVFSILKKKS